MNRSSINYFYVLLCLLLLSLSTVSCSEKSSQTSNEASGAKTTVTQFMQAWQNADYSRMWALTDPDLKQKTQFVAYKNAMSKFTLESFEVRSCKELDRNSAIAQVFRVLKSKDGQLTDRDVNSIQLSKVAQHWVISKH